MHTTERGRHTHTYARARTHGGTQTYKQTHTGSQTQNQAHDTQRNRDRHWHNGEDYGTVSEN